MNMKLLGLLSLICCCHLFAWQHSKGIRHENFQAGIQKQIPCDSDRCEMIYQVWKSNLDLIDRMYALANCINESRSQQFPEILGFGNWASENLQKEWNSNLYLGLPIPFDVSPDLRSWVFEILNANLSDYIRIKALAKYIKTGDSIESVERIIGKPWMLDGHGPGYFGCAYFRSPGLWIDYDPCGRVIEIKYVPKRED